MNDEAPAWERNAGRFDRPSSRTESRNELLEAALDFAARGWPVLPCGPKKLPLVAAAKGPDGQKIKGTGGVSAATIDPDQIRAWWRQWPQAMVGVAMGHPSAGSGHPVLCLDFDPRHDAETGEEWTLERLKGETEAQIGCALPSTLAVRTPSGGVHLYLAVTDGGPAIGNKGSLPAHVDVRGRGGYVIAPPSVNADGAAYRWLRGAADAPIANAPEQLLAVLRAPSRKIERSAIAPKVEGEQRGRAALTQDDAVRRYALAALDEECRELAATPIGGGRWGGRNQGIFHSALMMGTLVAAGALSESVVRAALGDVVRAMPQNDDLPGALQTLENGLTAGLAKPRDLSEIRDRSRSARAGAAARPPDPAAARRLDRAPFQDGRQLGSSPQPRRSVEMSEADQARLTAIAHAWFERRLEHADGTAKALTSIAWGVGRRVAAQLIEEEAAKALLWEHGEPIAELTRAMIDQAVDDGFNRGFDPGPSLLELKCSGFPMTDFGIAERFRERYGQDFRFTTAKGWLGWDQRRWKVLDQDEKTPPAEVIAAVFDTIRAIQTEARRVAETGTKYQLIERGKQQALDLDVPNPHALDRWVAVGKSWKLFSDMLSAWGRQSETTGKPAAVALLARRWLTVPIEQFDCEQLAINVANGTLRFAVETLPDGGKRCGIRCDPHAREDLITRLAPIAWDPAAECPLYDAMIAWAQPDPAVRRYVHQVGGYSCTGDTGQHLLWFNYGRGRNGKSTTIDTWCAALGDYSGTIGIESFLDQGIKKRGDAASPDLAKLGGVRLLRASEPERGAKLNSALIKAATGGEPMSVRALHRGFFDLEPRFKLLMSGNSKPAIPDTDEGIWGRMKLVPWLRHIEKPNEDPYRDKFPAAEWPAKDPHLTDKLKRDELPGVFRRLVEGLSDFLERGFVEPEGVTAATAEYRKSSDPLARFLGMCTVADPKGRAKSSELHAVFAAWCKVIGEKEWSSKGFAQAMEDKGYTRKTSDGVKWEGIRLIRSVSDFLDDSGNVRSDLPDLLPGEGGSTVPSGSPNEDDYSDLMP